MRVGASANAHDSVDERERLAVGHRKERVARVEDELVDANRRATLNERRERFQNDRQVEMAVALFKKLMAAGTGGRRFAATRRRRCALRRRALRRRARRRVSSPPPLPPPPPTLCRRQFGRSRNSVLQPRWPPP